MASPPKRYKLNTFKPDLKKIDKSAIPKREKMTPMTPASKDSIYLTALKKMGYKA